jgi:hypothetical protein
MSKRPILKISDDLSLPLDVITMRIAEYGDSGAGKTTFARLLAEKVHAAHHRFCAIDLKNDWWGLKSSADGKAAGIPVVIFGGPRADVKLAGDADAARALAETVTSIEQSIILDLDAMSRAKQEKFLSAFLDALYESNRRPLMLFCDEADRYAPQKPMSQEAIMSLSSSEDIARRGRKRGIGSFWLTQRTAVLNKNVSEFANLTIVFRTPGEKDLRELEDRVGRIANRDVVKEVMRLAPGLADGEAFFLSAHPKLRKFMPDPVRPIQLPLPWTYDSSATPGVGQRRREPKVLAKADLAAIESRIADQVKRAKDEDPKALRAELARLQRELAKTPASSPPAAMTAAAGELRRTNQRQAATIAALKKGLADAMKVIEELQKAGVVDREIVQKAVTAATDQIVRAAESRYDKVKRQATALLGQMQKLIDGVPDFSTSSSPTPARMDPPSPPTPARRSPSPPRGGDGEGAEGGTRLPRMAHAFLRALVQYPAGLTKARIMAITEYRMSGDVTKMFAEMGRQGWVSGEDGKLVITDAGRDAVGPVEPLPVGEKLRQRIVGEDRPAMMRKFMSILFDAYPASVPKKELLERSGYRMSGDVTKMWAKLVNVGLATQSGKGTLRASNDLYEDFERQEAGE